VKDVTEQIGSGTKKVRGRAQASLDLIEAIYAAAEAAEPITVRGVAYKLFVAGLIPSMAKSDVRRVGRLLVAAREEGTIPWEWIVDETREIEQVATWENPEQYMRACARSYRLDFWDQQDVRCEVWSEKGTVRGLLGPVLDEYAVGFRVMHGFSSATALHEAAEGGDGRILIVLYVGDFDPSGLHMSEEDLPSRLARYGGDHVQIKRIALTRAQLRGLPSFPVTDKKADPRYGWWVRNNYGARCWELDAMDPNVLRACVEREIKKLIDPIAWKRSEIVNAATRSSMDAFFKGWKAPGRP
jgi:hypothetical protein